MAPRRTCWQCGRRRSSRRSCIVRPVRGRGGAVHRHAQQSFDLLRRSGAPQVAGPVPSQAVPRSGRSRHRARERPAHRVATSPLPLRAHRPNIGAQTNRRASGDQRAALVGRRSLVVVCVWSSVLVSSRSSSLVVVVRRSSSSVACRGPCRHHRRRRRRVVASSSPLACVVRRRRPSVVGQPRGHGSSVVFIRPSPVVDVRRPLSSWSSRRFVGWSSSSSVRCFGVRRRLLSRRRQLSCCRLRYRRRRVFVVVVASSSSVVVCRRVVVVCRPRPRPRRRLSSRRRRRQRRSRRRWSSGHSPPLRALARARRARWEFRGPPGDRSAGPPIRARPGFGERL